MFANTLVVLCCILRNLFYLHCLCLVGLILFFLPLFVQGWERRNIGFLTIFPIDFNSSQANVITTKTIQLTVRIDIFCIWFLWHDEYDDIKVSKMSGKRDLGIHMCVSMHYRWSLQFILHETLITFFICCFFSQKQCTIQYECVGRFCVRNRFPSSVVAVKFSNINTMKTVWDCYICYVLVYMFLVCYGWCDLIHQYRIIFLYYSFSPLSPPSIFKLIEQ